MIFNNLIFVLSKFVSRMFNTDTTHNVHCTTHTTSYTLRCIERTESEITVCVSCLLLGLLLLRASHEMSYSIFSIQYINLY